MVFPEHFLWGVSMSGFQFEMGNAFGKGLDPNTDWFVWVHDSANIQKGLVSGDLPEDGVNYWSLYKKDHNIAKSLRLNAYRIGIEWSRIFPKTTSNIEVGIERASDGNIAKIEIDERDLEELDKFADIEAVNHYRTVIENLRTKGFKVFVCLNHFTLPLWIHDPIAVRNTKADKGPKGWIDESTIVEFTKYGAYLAWRLGDIVDNWATFNEPMVVAEAGYLVPQSGFPPGLRDFKACKKAATNMAIAHARAYDVLKKMDSVKADEESPSPSFVGVIHNIIPTKPQRGKKGDIRAAEFLNHVHNHFFIQSATTGWLDTNLNAKKERGEEKSHLRDRLDWLGINYYTRSVVKGRAIFLAKLAAGIPAIPQLVEGYGFACKPESESLDGMPTSDSGWEVYPRGIAEAVDAMKEYERPLYVMENGIADAEDTLRPRFIAEHLKLLDTMINEEKLDLRGYFHWSLTDNYEWAKGFKMKFGLYAVDLENKERKARKSAGVYKRIIEDGEVTGDIEKTI